MQQEKSSNTQQQKPYSNLIITKTDYVPQWNTTAVGISSDSSGLHVTTVDPDTEARHELIVWSDVDPSKLLQPTMSGDWLFRWAGEIVIDDDCDALNSRQRRLHEEMALEISALCENLDLRVRRGVANAKSSHAHGKQRSIEAARYAYAQRSRSLRRQVVRSLRQLLIDSPEGEDTSSTL